MTGRSGIVTEPAAPALDANTGEGEPIATNQKFSFPIHTATLDIGGRQKIGGPILFIKEEDGSFSVIAINLPGACAQGDTRIAAKAAIVSVLEAMLDESRLAGKGRQLTCRSSRLCEKQREGSLEVLGNL